MSSHPPFDASCLVWRSAGLAGGMLSPSNRLATEGISSRTSGLLEGRGRDGYRPDGRAGGGGMALQDPSGLAGATRWMATPAGVGARSTVASGATGLAVLGARH